MSFTAGENLHTLTHQTNGRWSETKFTRPVFERHRRNAPLMFLLILLPPHPFSDLSSSLSPASVFSFLSSSVCFSLALCLQYCLFPLLLIFLFPEFCDLLFLLLRLLSPVFLLPHQLIHFNEWSKTNRVASCQVVARDLPLSQFLHFFLLGELLKGQRLTLNTYQKKCKKKAGVNYH